MNWEIGSPKEAPRLVLFSQSWNEYCWKFQTFHTSPSRLGKPRKIIKSSASTVKSFGTNIIDTGAVATVNDGFGSTQAFSTNFSQSTPGPSNPQTADEGQGTTGDSGGAIFYKNSSNAWELAGMMFDIDTYAGQPANASLYGNTTYSADVATYHDQITAVVPEPSACVLLAAGALVFGASRLRLRKKR